MTHIEAMKLALEALEKLLPLVRDQNDWYGATIDRGHTVIKALEEALAKQEQGEPVAWLHESGVLRLDKYIEDIRKNLDSWTPLYTTPQQRKPLEFSQMVRLTYDIDEDKPATQQELYNLIRKVEAAHGIIKE